MSRLPAMSLLTLSIALSGCNPSDTVAHDKTKAADAVPHNSATKLDGIQCVTQEKAPQGTGTIAGLNVIGTYQANAPFDTSAAEIVSYDACTDKLYVVNAQAQKVDVLALNAQSAPQYEGSINLDSAAQHAGISIGAANSVSTHQGLVAVAIENANKQQNGIVGLYRSDTLELITTFAAGALPDMVSFSKDGQFIATANEGEPSADYQTDPEGSVTLINLSAGIDNAQISQIDFRAFNQERADEINEVRVTGPNATAAQDFEPEYLTFANNGKLYVALQENNALAILDVASAKVDSIVNLGEKSWGQAQLDASNKDKATANFRAYPQLTGLYMPDSIDSYEVDGATYIVTANEGDGREYGFETTQAQCDKDGFIWDGDDFSGSADYTQKQAFCIVHTDETRGKNLDVAPEHPLANALKDKTQLGRLKVIQPQGQIAANQNVQSFGTRSFSIWNAQGELVFDSGDQFSEIVAMHESKYMNSTNDNNASGDDRSDDKGVEPEAIEVANINQRQYAFIGLERQGGIMIYDVTKPKDAQFLHYVNRRDFSAPVCTKVDSDGDCENGQYNPKAGDLGPESITYFERRGGHFLAVGNEVSGTTTVYQIEL
ncbi:alkaline phosphatase [Vibrio sp. SM6]|uniref:Alkaline phosphatase n=1 Tax=Vibrio agarilyticus TaxID=2726741 RepID=A0A7X8YIP9_9VIBR|nr:choice-of-anchor I family protein [Vibrio agarilyticus]NLS14816.1 alkaline phosphatase [Vibrio agarilyticus]